MRNGLVADYETVAAYLANGDDDDQVKFFTVFCKELRACCKTHYNTEMQLAFVSGKLSAEDRRLLEMLGPEQK